MKRTYSFWAALLPAATLVLAGAACGGDDSSDDTADADDVTPDAAPAYGCAAYCAQITMNCSGPNAQYESEADCMSYCEEVDWPVGEDGAQEGNSLACRTYHSGAPAMTNATLHCPHGGPTGDGVCGVVDFRNDAAASYTRVDAMGVPGVSTFLVPSAQANAYNDASPDSSGSSTAFTASIEALHTALNADLNTKNLDACATNGGTTCQSQDYKPGSTVATLMLPTDRLTLDTTVAAGFPNGRQLTDRVMDVMLAMLLLDLDGGDCNGTPCTLTTFSSVPTNPGENDKPFDTAFPYLAPASE